MKLAHLVIILTAATTSLFGQTDRWQQRVEYKMNVELNAKKHQFEGTQSIVYYNNSPDTLHRIFYHLYFNAFQPGSEMDVRSITIADPDPRVGDRISKLSKKERGYIEVKELKMNGDKATLVAEGTILEVTLVKPILPHSKATLELTFEGQVPLQIRRCGRDSREGIDYSMSQWYPKLCEYDYQGWHANPYIAREFYGIWGDYDVSITLDSKYTIGATGTLQNPQEIGKGYEATGTTAKQTKDDNLTWHFKAVNVHDFVWAADPDYKHTQVVADDGTLLHFVYQETEKNREAWAKLPNTMAKAFGYISQQFGKYPYPSYSFIQGGDGGMEYPMATLITGDRPYGSLVGVAVHELMHSWYQCVLATNESLYPWMDEGFTSYTSTHVTNFLIGQKLLPGAVKPDPMLDDVEGYCRFALGGSEEPLSTHADHYITNTAYGVGSYTKGSVFLEELQYILGKPTFDAALLEYFNTWKFKHPNPNDCIRVFEQKSGLELDWFKEYYVNTTNTIDYAIGDVEREGRKKTSIQLNKIGNFPMPLDVVVTFEDGKQEVFYIPLDLMRGEKPNETPNIERTTMPDWPWTNPMYELIIPERLKKITAIEIDPSHRIADVNRGNNKTVIK